MTTALSLIHLNVCLELLSYSFRATKLTAKVSAHLRRKCKSFVIFLNPLPSVNFMRFLGLINFYHRFLPNCADTLQPLNELLSTSKGSTKTILWSENATAAFATIKEALANATLLSHPKPDAPTSIMTDASDIAAGAVLQQYIGNGWRPISYFSKKLKPAESRYSTFDRELLAVYFSSKHFRHFVKGRTFHTLTDNKPLMYAFSSRSDRYTPRQVRHLDYISQFTTCQRC